VVLDNELMIVAEPSESAGIYKNYEDLRKRLSEEMNNWTLCSHEVDEFLKTSDENGTLET